MGAWQVQRHGFWPTVRHFLTGWQGGAGQGARQGQGRQQGAAGQAAPQGRQTKQQRFEEVARVVQSLPMEDVVTREDLQRCSLHDLRVCPFLQHRQRWTACDGVAVRAPPQ